MVETPNNKASLFRSQKTPKYVNPPSATIRMSWINPVTGTYCWMENNTIAIASVEATDGEIALKRSLNG